MAVVVIGVDPHRAHTRRWRSMPARSRWASCGCVSRLSRPGGCWSGRGRGPSGPGRSKAPAGWGICWPSSCSRRVSGCWMWRPGWPPGCGCWRPGTSTRTTPTMPARWRSPRCARPMSGRPGVMITPRCSRSGPSATRTWAGPAPRWPARLHQVLCELVPGGVPGEISAGQAARFLESVTPAGAVDAARWELAAELTEDLRGIDARIRETRKKAAAAVRAAGTSLTGLFGVGPVIAATVIGDVRHVSRFGNRDRFAAYNGTAPIEVSSGGRKACRLSRRGNRRLNHAIHMVAITQIRYRHTKGRAYYDKKLAEGKTPKEALRALKHQISDAISPACRKTPGAPPRRRARDGNRGTTLHPGRPTHTPTTGSSGKPLPGLPPTLRPPPLPLPRRCHPVRASGRVKDRAQPGRAAAPAGRPRRGHERADNAPQRKGGPAPRRTAIPAGSRSRITSALPLDFETKRCSFCSAAWPSARRPVPHPNGC